MSNPNLLSTDVLASLLSDRRGYWIFDLDGTLIDLAESPLAVDVPSHLIESLKRLADQTDQRLAILSGRSLRDLERLIPLPVTLIGNHGLEWRQDGVSRVIPPDSVEGGHALDAIRGPLEKLSQALPGTYFEDKTWTFSFHYRHLSPRDWPDLKERLQKILSPYASLYLAPAHRCFEIRLRDGMTKGDAVQMLLGTSKFVPIVFGDDVTDEDAFRSAQSGITVIVGPRRPTIAQYFLPTPSDVQKLLRQLTI